MYALIKNNAVDKYPYSYNQLLFDNPQTSFPSEPTEETLTEWDVYPVLPAPEPQVPVTQNVTEGTPENIDGAWTQVWVVTDKTPEEIAEYNAQQKQARLYAYEQEADSVFFKWQRGEATQQEWLDKVEEVKLQYPYIE